VRSAEIPDSCEKPGDAGSPPRVDEVDDEETQVEGGAERMEEGDDGETQGVGGEGEGTVDEDKTQVDGGYEQLEETLVYHGVDRMEEESQDAEEGAERSASVTPLKEVVSQAGGHNGSVEGGGEVASPRERGAESSPSNALEKGEREGNGKGEEVEEGGGVDDAETEDEDEDEDEDRGEEVIVSNEEGASGEEEAAAAATGDVGAGGAAPAASAADDDVENDNANHVDNDDDAVVITERPPVVKPEPEDGNGVFMQPFYDGPPITIDDSDDEDVVAV
jgi:hypothetical protein